MQIYEKPGQKYPEPLVIVLADWDNDPLNWLERYFDAYTVYMNQSDIQHDADVSFALELLIRQLLSETRKRYALRL